MNEFENSTFYGEQILQIPASDRSYIYHRLQELNITCFSDVHGYLHIQTNNSQEVIIVRTVLMEVFASRDQLVTWLEQCWH